MSNTSHYKRFVRTLVMGPLLATMDCAAPANNNDGGTSDASVCTCCTGNSLEGTECVNYAAAPDSGVMFLNDGGIVVPEGGTPPVRTVLSPPSGSRWCVTSADMSAAMCPIAGPLPPPELLA